MWFRISRREGDSAETFGHVEAGAMMIMLNRGDYWQCAYVIQKGGIDAVKREGIDAFRERVRRMSPFLAGRLKEIGSFDDVKLLTVTIDRLRQWWRPGLLCIGDAAHAMSPVGGVGINLAIQDAVAAANLLWSPLKTGKLEDAHLAAVQARRTLPMRVIQWLQVKIQEALLRLVFEAHRQLEPPAMLRLIGLFPVLRRIPARLVGIGIRPEHVGSPEDRTAFG